MPLTWRNVYAARAEEMRNLSSDPDIVQGLCRIQRYKEIITTQYTILQQQAPLPPPAAEARALRGLEEVLRESLGIGSSGRQALLWLISLLMGRRSFCGGVRTEHWVSNGVCFECLGPPSQYSQVNLSSVIRIQPTSCKIVRRFTRTGSTPPRATPQRRVAVN